MCYSEIENSIYHNQIEQAMNRIRMLNPKPGSQYTSHDRSPYILPDVVMIKFADEFYVALSDFSFPQIKINEDYESGGLYVMAREEGIVGAISIVPENELDALPFWRFQNAREIARVAVAPGQQGKGIGFQLRHLGKMFMRIEYKRFAFELCSKAARQQRIQIVCPNNVLP